jgi:hypothetical protein
VECEELPTDGCDKPFHIRCTDISALDSDEDWFCRPGCPGEVPRQVTADEEVEEDRGGGAPGDVQGEKKEYRAKRAGRYKGVSWFAQQ